MKDPYFRVEVIDKISAPNIAIYHAMHTDYSEEFVWDELREDKEVWKKTKNNGFEKTGKVVTEYVGKPETELGEIVVKHLLAGNRGHFGCLEHCNIIFNVGWFPHSTMQQIRTHRVGVSFDVQSFRYSGKRIVDVANGNRSIEEVFYLRPVGDYSDRQGKHYTYTEGERLCDLNWCKEASIRYAEKIEKGFSEEHARSTIPFDIRQHFVMSANARSLMHLLDLRWKQDAQLECQWLCDLIFPHFENWMPEVAEWYSKNRAKKARLAP